MDHSFKAKLPKKPGGSHHRTLWRRSLLLTLPIGLLVLSGCPSYGTRLLSETSSRGLTASYKYSGDTQMVAEVLFTWAGQPDRDLLFSNQPSPSVYPLEAGNSAETETNYATGSLEVVEYRAGILTDTTPNVAGVKVSRMEATYYAGSGDVKMTAKYHWLLFGSSALNDLSVALDRILYYQTDGSYMGALIFEYAQSNYLSGVVTRTTYKEVDVDGTLRSTRITDYTWDDLAPVQRCRFLAEFHPEGEMLTYSSLAKSNLKATHSAITDANGQVTETDTVYDLVYDSGRLRSVVANGFQWDLAYEQYRSR